ncbi:MAG: coiled-coil domain-containing protein [Acidimicrobiales bacterium]
MRFDDLRVRAPGHELELSFHDRITVLDGLGPPERALVGDALMAVLAGTELADGAAVLSYRDASGRTAVASCDGTPGARPRWLYEDGAPAPDPLEALGLDAEELRELLWVGPGDLGVADQEGPDDHGGPTTSELDDAREALNALGEEQESVDAARCAVEAMREEIDRVETRLDELAQGRPRREHARLAGKMVALRAELEARQRDAESAAERVAMLERARTVAEMGEIWRAARAERLHQQEPTPARPDRPKESPERREARRKARAKARKPVDPVVEELARKDQDALWPAAFAVVAARSRAEEESLALGGLQGEGMGATLAERIEAAHHALESAENQLRRQRAFDVVLSATVTGLALLSLIVVPLAGPMAIVAAVAAAYWAIVRPGALLGQLRAAEAEALEQAGAPSYRAFHFRRIDGVIDPDAQDRLQSAMHGHREALSRWHSLAGSVEPRRALDLEAEIRAHAEALATAAATPPPAPDSSDAGEAPPIPRGRRARRAALRTAARHEASRRSVLVAELAAMGRPVEGADDGSLEEALEALRTEADAAVRDAPVGGSDGAGRAPVEEIEAELAEMERRLEREHRPEWGEVTPDEASEADAEELRLVARREELTRACAWTERQLNAGGQAGDRRRALEARVERLERESRRVPRGRRAGRTRGATTEGPLDLERRVTARFIEARYTRAGDGGLPLVLDDPFRSVHGEQKWRVLDLLDRLAERVQLLYLTEDPDVVVWARRRSMSASNPLALVETYSR